jgi:hypothetical protein
MNLKNQLFIEFLYIRLSHLKFAESRKSFFNLKCPFCCAIFRPFDSAALNDRTTQYNEDETQCCQLLYLLTLLLTSLKIRVSLEYV